MDKMLIKNLKDYSVVAFSLNPAFQSISFKPQEVKDCTGIESDSPDNFRTFVNSYVHTNILTLIPVSDYIPPVINTHGYFEFAYIQQGWSVSI